MRGLRLQEILKYESFQKPGRVFLFEGEKKKMEGMPGFKDEKTDGFCFRWDYIRSSTLRVEATLRVLWKGVS
jgi:hypothetical protein